MNKKVYQNRLRQLMLKCFALVLFLTAGAAFSTLTAQNQGAVANRTISKQVSATRVSVTGQMPQAAQVTVTQVQRSAVQGKQVKGAYDITIKNGTAKWQPAAGQPAMVTISDANFVDGEYMDVYHEGANGNEFVATVAAENGKITFPARSFSVYIVTETGQDARLKLNFYQNSDQVTNNNPVVIYVKKADITGGHYNSIVYDPGAGTLASGVTFFGWVEDKPNYTIEDTAAATALTIAEIRAEVQTKLNGSYSDGDEVNYYAMLFKTYIVSYYDGSPATLGSDNLFFRADAPQTQYPYQISRTYVPTSSEYNFMGWVVKDETPSTAANIVNPQTDGLYEFGDNITIQGNVNFSVDEEQGHWLVFDENGKGATYNAPQFVKNGDVTSDADLLPMTRPGYTFGGWYKDADCTTGNEFTFGGQLTERTIIYAKWTAHTEADYSVIVWMQKLTDHSDPNNPNADYDFGQTFRIEDGAVGTHPNVVVGTAGASSVTIDGNTVSETGFHYASTDQATVTINPEGTSVVNVYLDRDEITLNFNLWNYTYTATTSTSNNTAQYGLVDGAYLRLTRHGNYNNYYWTYGDDVTYTGTRYTRSGGNSWVNYKSFTGRYGSTLAENGKTWPSEYDWHETGGNNGSTSGTRTTFLDAFLPASSSTTVNFYGDDPSGDATAYFYKQNPDGNGYTLANTVSVSDGSTFYLSDKYNGFQCKAWNNSNNTTTWTLVGGTYTSGNNTYYDANASQTGNQNVTINGALHVYFDVLKYDLEFASGSTFTGNNGTNPETGAPTYGSYEETLSPDELHTESDVAYGLSISNFADYVPDESTWPEGYVFDGWYADDQCSTPYTFSTMPANNVMLYAKWRQIRFRVFLHPNAYIEDEQNNTLVKDESLDWGSETQAMNFAVAWGGKISVPTGRRSGYEFIGWFTDPEFLHPFDKDALILNNTNVPATPAYDKTVDMTDEMDKWGEIVDEDDAFNSDVDRPWVQRKYDLYAQWRATVDGAIGIDVVYDPNGGTNQPTDQNHYLDAAKATAGAASTAPANKVFSHWVVQKYNCTNNTFDDTQVTVYPGETFTIHRNDALIEVSEWCDPLDDSPQNHPQARMTVTPSPCNHLTPPTDTYTVTTEDPETGETTTETRGYTKIYDAEYTIHLRAEYVDVEQPQPTFIIWYNNYENADPAIVRQDGNTGQQGDNHEELVVNHAVTIPTPAERSGYKFLGWSKYRVQLGENETISDVPTTHETGDDDPNFLVYTPGENGAAGTYTSAETADAATEVAADELDPYDFLYAVWEQTCEVPVVSVQNVTVCQGTTATLEATITEQQDGVNYTYQWYTVSDSEEPAAISNATDATYQTSTAGTYGVIVSVGEDCASEMATATVTINELPEVTVADVTVCEGTDAVLTATTENTVTYQWYTVAADGTETAIDEATEATYTAEEAGTYKVVVTANNCTAADDATVTINPKPIASLTVPTDADDLCPNQGTYEVSADASNGTAPYTFAWTGATANTDQPSTATVAQQGQSDCDEDGTTYTVSVVVTDDKNCASVAAEGSFTVKMATGGITMTEVETSKPVTCASDVVRPTLPVVTDACGNPLTPTDSVIPTAPACGGPAKYIYTYTDCAGNTATWEYTYTVSGPVNPELTVFDTTATAAGNCTYTIPAVRYTAFASCDGTVTVTQSPEAGEEYVQTTEEQTITITLTATDDCDKTTTATTTVTIPAKVTASINAETESVCYGGTAYLQAVPAEGYTYQWSDNQQITTSDRTIENMIQTTTFTVTITDANGCTADASKEITVNEMEEATITGEDEICLNGSTTLTAPAGASYLWDNGEETQAITVSPTTTTTYKVTVVAQNGCTSAGEIVVTVNPLPEVTVATEPVCEGSNATLTATATNVSYQWKNTNGNISGATQATYSTNVADEYTVEVTDLTTGCKNTASATVVINPNPVIALDSVRPTCTEKGSITVNVTTPTVADYTYTMNNEEPVITNLTSYTFGGLNAGSYNFTLADANGCSTTAAQTLTLDQDEIVLTPITMDVCNNYEFDTVPNGANDQIKYAWAAPQCDPNISDALYQSSWATTPQGTIKGKLVNSGSQAGHAVYTVTPTLGDCALGVVTVTVTVDAVVRPEVSLNIDATSPVCANQGDLDVTAEVTNSTLGYTLTWTWQGEETPQTAQVGTGSVTHTIAIPSDVDMPSTYTLQLAYNDGVCRAATSTEIVVNPLPTLTVTPATQTITFGQPMGDVQVDTANASALNIAAPAGFTFNETSKILSYNMDPRGNMPPVGTHTIYLNAPGLAPCGTAVDSVKVIVEPKPLTIEIACEKMYDGTPFVVTYDNTECVTVTGLVDGDELTAGKATTYYNNAESYKVGHYTYTPASGLSFAAIEDGDVLVDPAFASTYDLENYDVTYDIALDITLRPITITAHDSTKMYDGVALTDTIYTISGSGLAENDEIASIAQSGSQFCVGTADHTISNALIIKTDDNNENVTDQYDITYVDGTLTVTDYTEFECPDDLTIELNFGQCDTVFEPEIPTIEAIAEGMYTISNNLDELNPLDTGVHVITWMLTDTCHNIMATCDQTVTVVFRECPEAVDADNNTYQSVRIGCDCWTQTNLVSETYGSEVGGGAIEDVMTYNATPYFDDEAANEETYGHLYTWNAAIKDGTDNGYGHIQGICPDGWYLPTKEKYEGLAAYGPEALRADILWADGGGTNTTGFTGLPGGRYVGNILLYRDMTIMDYYWATTTDDAGVASAVEVELTMNCLRVKNVLNTNPNGYSIRCIKEREPETEGTETTEP